MSDIKRFLSRRDRSKAPKDTAERVDIPVNLHGLFSETVATEKLKLSEQELKAKIKEVRNMLLRVGITKFPDGDISYVLKSSYIKGDTKKAYESLNLLEDSEEGIIRPYNPKIKLLGAVNWNGVSCYLDSTLFAIFGRLDSFEAMLYNTFEDEHRKNLATLLRLWVNTVRAGRLVESDVVKRLQEAIAACGWTEAAKTEQQDASEAFSFIAEKLELPMLTLKMDLFHTGKEDADDDHKFIRERLLEVAIPDDRQDGEPIKLEDCLETYFNSRVEIKRYLERRATANSTRRMSHDSFKGQVSHIESVEIAESNPSTPASAFPPSSLPAYLPSRPGLSPIKHRTPSIIQETYVYEKDEKAALKAELARSESFSKRPPGRPRAGTLRKEVMMPAWQFFSLIPWYTDVAPNSDAQIAQHFSAKRPVLGICLKRYSFTPAGEAIKRGAYIDIPIEIGLPQFIHDDNMSDDAAAFGNFKLSLQSVVCHRGNSVYAGHYISLVRGSWADGSDKWMLFDDLASERIRAVDIQKVLTEESPYLLFYQIQPIEGDPNDISRAERPPSYLFDTRDSGIAGASSISLGGQGNEIAASTGRGSLDEPEPVRYRGRPSSSRERRISIAFTDPSSTDLSKSEDTGNNAGVTSTLSRRQSRKSKYSAHSRASSQNGNKRLSRSFQNLAEKFNPLAKAGEAPVNERVKLSEPSAYSENSAGLPTTAVVPKESRSRLRKDIRDKSRDKSRGRSIADDGNGARLTKSKKGERPDRECVVM